MPKVHLIGIGGAGLSAIATVLLQQGYTVSGSDRQASGATGRLSRLGATVFTGHRAENIAADLDTVVISSAIPADNPEIVAARQRGIPVVKRAEWLGQMMAGRFGIAVAGSHGKTTTTAILAFVLHRLGQAPTYIVGGYVPQLATNAAAGSGPAFVIEADEYDYTFLGLRPAVAVITNIEWDHPDLFPTAEAVRLAFSDFVRLVPANGLVVACGDEAEVRTVAAQAVAPVVTYGLQPDNDWQAVDLRGNEQGGYDFKVVRRNEAGPAATVGLAVPGRHNVRNALAGLVVAVQQGLSLSQVAAVLGQFSGVGRRFELKGEVNGITIIDDYAHHPTEIKATLAAARARFGQRPLWVLLQPHTYSRTLALLADFAAAFSQADHVIVVDIFASREIDAGLVHSRDIVARMSHRHALYIGPLTAAADYLSQQLRPGDVLLTLGAGDGDQVGEWVLSSLLKRKR
jgi:UDP-N-acetylmuramate--alanine ligase